jgi:dipeptidase D
MILAVVADPDVPHGPLELLFTVGEEAGSVGASAVDPATFRGRILLNLDTEAFGEITSGSAEGQDTLLRFTHAARPPQEGWAALGIALSGLRGGHSGLEISTGRLNAIRGLARLLWAVKEVSALRLTALEGGERGNAIPSWARARVILPSEDESKVRAAVARQTEVLREQFPGEGKFTIDVIGPEAAASALSAEDTRSVLALLLELPNGAVAMSQRFPGLVETSNNVAVVKTTEGLPGQTAGAKAFTIECSSRSTLGGGLGDVATSIAAVAGLADAEVEAGKSYIGWVADPASRAVAALKCAYADVNRGQEPRVVTTHGGLECGVLASRIPGLDVVSFGPTIERAHSAGERVHAPSVAACYRVLARTLAVLSG